VLGHLYFLSHFSGSESLVYLSYFTTHFVLSLSLSSFRMDDAAAEPDFVFSKLDMPALSSTMKEGKVVSWLKSEGDKVEAGEAIMVVESDKADMDVEAFEDGYIAAIITGEGETALVGTPVALIAANEADIPALKAYASCCESCGSGARCHCCASQSCTQGCGCFFGRCFCWWSCCGISACEKNGTRNGSRYFDGCRNRPRWT
jgi:hypothetical protein